MLVYVKKDGFGNFQSLFIIFIIFISFSRFEFATFDTKQAPKTVKMGCRLVKWGIDL